LQSPAADSGGTETCVSSVIDQLLEAFLMRGGVGDVQQ
jgi:hypothetical protein